MSVEKSSYQLVRYEKQKCPDSPGVEAGMWCIIETTHRRIGFFDTEGDAHHMAKKMGIELD